MATSVTLSRFRPARLRCGRYCSIPDRSRFDGGRSLALDREALAEPASSISLATDLLGGSCVHVVSGHYAGWTNRSTRSRGRGAHWVSALEQASDIGIIFLGRARGHRLRLEFRYRLGPLDLWPSSPYEYTNGPRP